MSGVTDGVADDRRTGAPATPAGPGPRLRVEVLMAAYQGAAWVERQVASVLGQAAPDGADVRLVARDDGSTDGTWELLVALAARHPDRLTVSRRPTNSGSAARNFLEMVAASDADVLLLCDDDDEWLPGHVAHLVARVRAVEAAAGRSTPVLVHSDAVVVDGEDRVLAPSLWALQQLDPRRTSVPHLLVQNVVTGCTVAFNRGLADRVREPYDDVAMHDWWLALLAAALGRVDVLDEPTVRYRQHGANTVGAKSSRSPAYALSRLLDPAGTRQRVAASVRQAAALLAVHGAELPPAARAVVADLAGSGARGWWGRRAVLVRHGLWKGTAVRRLGQLLFS